MDSFSLTDSNILYGLHLKTSISLYKTSSFVGSIWFMPFFSTYGMSFGPLGVGYRATRVFDSGWMEYFDCPNPKNVWYECLGARHQHYGRNTEENSLNDDCRQILASCQYWG